MFGNINIFFGNGNKTDNTKDNDIKASDNNKASDDKASDDKAGNKADKQDSYILDWSFFSNLAYFKKSEDDDDCTLTLELEDMDKEMRDRLQTVMNMYNYDATHLSKCIAPIVLVSELLKKPLEDLAMDFPQETIDAWNWKDNKKNTPRVGAIIPEYTAAVKALYSAIETNNDKAQSSLFFSLPKLKQWRYFLRLWRQGRQYYTDFRCIMPGKSFEEINSKMQEELGQLATRPSVDDKVQELIKAFRKAQQAKELKDITPHTGLVALVAAAESVQENEDTHDLGKEYYDNLWKGNNEEAKEDNNNNNEDDDDDDDDEDDNDDDDDEDDDEDNSEDDDQDDEDDDTPDYEDTETETEIEDAKEIDDEVEAVEVEAEIVMDDDSTNKVNRNGKRKAGPVNHNKRKAGPVNHNKRKGSSKRLKHSTASDSTVIPPEYNKETKLCARPSAQWVEIAKNKITLLKCLAAHCQSNEMDGSFFGSQLDVVLAALFEESNSFPQKYNRPFLVLMVAILYKLSYGEGNVVSNAIKALVAKKLLTPDSLAKFSGKNLQTMITKSTGKRLKTVWMSKIAHTLVSKHNGEVPVSPNSLAELDDLVDTSVITTVLQDGHGYYYRPGLDCRYGVPVLIALELIDTADIDIPERVNITHAQKSLSTWLRVYDWKDIGKLLANVGALALDGDPIITEIIKKKFVKADSELLLTMMSQIHDYFHGHFKKVHMYK